MSVDKKNLEDVVLIILIAVGLIGCSFFFFQDGGKPLSAFFAAFALSCIVYRFLGGIAEETSFRMGFLKLGGSAAFIIASIWFLNTQVFVPRDTIILTMPERTRWYPVRLDTGRPDTVRVLNSNGVKDSFQITEQDHDVLKKNEYTLELEGESKFRIKKEDLVLGFANTTLNNKPKQIHEPDIFKLNPFGEQREFVLPKYPFKVVVEQNYFSVRLLSSNDPVCKDCANLEVTAKKHIFFEVGDTQYFCFVLQANYKIDPDSCYARFLVGRIDFRN